MYSETDIESAVIAGVLSTDAANALRTHVASQRVTPLVDEENFRLLTGFNDIFVSIAGVLLLVGASWIGGTLHPAVGAAAVAALAWGLSEYFTRIRRMALPSILFLLGFVGGIFGVAFRDMDFFTRLHLNRQQHGARVDQPDLDRAGVVAVFP